MKTSSLRIRISGEDKAKIEAHANRVSKSVSEILRVAAASAISGEVPGAQERHASATVRRAANQVLDILDGKPIDVGSLREALVKLRTAARDVVQCR